MLETIVFICRNSRTINVRISRRGICEFRIFAYEWSGTGNSAAFSFFRWKHHSFPLPFPLPTAPQLESSNRVILLARMSCGREEFRGLHETSPRLSLSPPFDNVTSRKVSWLVVTCRGRRKDGEGRQRSEISRELRSPGDTVGPSEREMGMQRRLRSATFATSAFGLSRLNNFPPPPR